MGRSERRPHHRRAARLVPSTAARDGLQREHVEISRLGLHWEEIDEDISIAGLLAGRGDMTRLTEQAL